MKNKMMIHDGDRKDPALVTKTLGIFCFHLFDNELSYFKNRFIILMLFSEH